jgi:hypothetical protein
MKFINYILDAVKMLFLASSISSRFGNTLERELSYFCLIQGKLLSSKYFKSYIKNNKLLYFI